MIVRSLILSPAGCRTALVDGKKQWPVEIPPIFSRSLFLLYLLDDRDPSPPDDPTTGVVLLRALTYVKENGYESKPPSLAPRVPPSTIRERSAPG